MTDHPTSSCIASVIVAFIATCVIIGTPLHVDAVCATTISGSTTACATCPSGYYGTTCETGVGPLDGTGYLAIFELVGCLVALLMFVVWGTAMIYGYHHATLTAPTAEQGDQRQNDDVHETEEEEYQTREEEETAVAGGPEDKEDDTATAGEDNQEEKKEEAEEAGEEEEAGNQAGQEEEVKKEEDAGETEVQKEDDNAQAQVEDDAEEGAVATKDKDPEEERTSNHYTTTSSSHRRDGPRDNVEPHHDPDSPPRARSVGGTTGGGRHHIHLGMYSGVDGSGNPCINQEQVNHNDHAPPPPTMSAAAGGRSWMASSTSNNSNPIIRSNVGRNGAGRRGVGITNSLSRPDGGAVDSDGSGSGSSGVHPSTRSRRSTSVKRKNLPPTRSVSVAENAQADNASAMSTVRGGGARQQSVDPFGTPFATNNRSVSEPMVMMMSTPLHQQPPYAPYPPHPYYYGGPPPLPPQGGGYYVQPQTPQRPGPAGGSYAAPQTPQAVPPHQQQDVAMTPLPPPVQDKREEPKATPRPATPQQEPDSRRTTTGDAPVSRASTPPPQQSTNANSNPIAKRATELSRALPAEPLSREVSPERKPQPRQKFVEGDTLRRNYLHPEITCNFGGNVQEVLCGEQVVVTRALTQYVDDPLEGEVAVHQYFVSGGDQACHFDIEPLFSLQGNALNGSSRSSSLGRAVSVARGGGRSLSQQQHRGSTPTQEDDEPRVRFE